MLLSYTRVYILHMARRLKLALHGCMTGTLLDRPTILDFALRAFLAAQSFITRWARRSCTAGYQGKDGQDRYWSELQAHKFSNFHHNYCLLAKSDMTWVIISSSLGLRFRLPDVDLTVTGWPWPSYCPGSPRPWQHHQTHREHGQHGQSAKCRSAPWHALKFMLRTLNFETVVRFQTYKGLFDSHHLIPWFFFGKLLLGLRHFGTTNFQATTMLQKRCMLNLWFELHRHSWTCKAPIATWNLGNRQLNHLGCSAASRDFLFAA